MIFLILALFAQSHAASTSVAKQPDACALLTNDDVRTALGSSIQQRQPTTQESGGLLVAQCYLNTGTPRSVSIAIAGNTKSGGKVITPRAFWRDQFHARSERPSGKSGGREVARNDEPREHETEGEARRIRGIGDEAFWSGTRVAGALYVLRGERFIRVSVGGIRDEKERIEKSRQLAVAALARLK